MHSDVPERWMAYSPEYCPLGWIYFDVPERRMVSLWVAYYLECFVCQENYYDYLEYAAVLRAYLVSV
jgi:hypothetical protein